MEQTLVGAKAKFSLVLDVRNLTPSTYILRFERNKMDFKPGQYVTIGLPLNSQAREYSIYSSVALPYLEVLIKEVETGVVSKKLKRITPGDQIEVKGPFGYFGLEESKMCEKYLFIASGTGISPFHSIITSHPNLNYTLLHGVRTSNEGYDKEVYDKSRYIQCTSRDDGGDFSGRVTAYLRQHPVDPQMFIYLCGNNEMIDEAYRILEGQGVPPAHLFAEVYF